MLAKQLPSIRTIPSDTLEIPTRRVLPLSTRVSSVPEIRQTVPEFDPLIEMAKREMSQEFHRPASMQTRTLPNQKDVVKTQAPAKKLLFYS